MFKNLTVDKASVYKPITNVDTNITIPFIPSNVPHNSSCDKDCLMFRHCRYVYISLFKPEYEYKLAMLMRALNHIKPARWLMHLRTRSNTAR